MALMNPKEGMVTWTDGLVMMPGAPEDLAYEFVNAYMTPEVGVFLINNYGYGSGNTKAYGQVPKQTLVELGIEEPASIIAKTWFQREIDPSILPKYQEVYEEIKLS